MPLGRVVQVVEVATRRPTRGLTLCDKAEVGRSASHIDYATTGHLPGRRLRAHRHHGGGRAGGVLVGAVAAVAGGDEVGADGGRGVADRAALHLGGAGNGAGRKGGRRAVGEEAHRAAREGRGGDRV